MAASPEVGAWHTVARRKKGPRSNNSPHAAARQAKAGLDQPDARSTSAKHPIIKNGRLQEPLSTPSQHQSHLAEIDRTYGRVRTAYTSSPSYAALEALVRTHAASHAPITRAICLGNGPLHAPDSSWDRRRAANIQTATFLALVELLTCDLFVGSSSSSHEKKPRIRCIFQEPLYTAADRAYLTTTLGCEVVDDPDALEHVTEDSLVWGVHMYHSVYGDILCRVAEPAMLVGTPWDVWDALPPDEDGRVAESLKGLAKMDASAEYDLFAFPQDEGHFTFCDTGIYWRRNRTMAAQDKPLAAENHVGENDGEAGPPEKEAQG
ncbi:hypothetical protein MCOR25_005959 [Pyricularia grisea]|uniref:SRR1-like domain-containing protein n=1 Tax=Pyricularia grisea TaxID=148305 RepID=A0A6P8AXY9_PYRGI|nr:hypothetical protein PgNI_11018 [Pyricularia grisea]KAI6363240.1 hypothetical protein MCOR25_005959 [Pyricularia grisea]TLD07151.1 hypothetical protein PgNI_11018 [Pyricularia grisea]